MQWRDWLEVGFYGMAMLGCGSFFTWLMQRLEAVSASMRLLRAHEHKQNNAMQELILRARVTEEHMLAIRRHLRVPGMTES